VFQNASNFAFYLQNEYEILNFLPLIVVHFQLSSLNEPSGEEQDTQLDDARYHHSIS